MTRTRRDRRDEARPLYLTVTFALAPFLGALATATAAAGRSGHGGWADNAHTLVTYGIFAVLTQTMGVLMDKSFARWAEAARKTTTQRPQARFSEPWTILTSTMFLLGLLLQALVL